MNTHKQNQRAKVSTGTVWEEMAGYSRAIRVENRILVAGTTAVGPDGIVGMHDPAEQMRYVLNKIEQAIKELGGTLNDVIRTRIYVSDINDWEIIAKIHGEKFHTIRPVNTLVQAKLVSSDCLVEVEAEAIIA